MLKLRTILKSIGRRNVSRTWRCLVTEIEQERQRSFRERVWEESRARYSNYENVFYSSHLELQEEHMSYGLRRSLANRWKREIRQNTIHPSRKTPVAPNNWMEDYEYYEGSSKSIPEDRENGENLGTADADEPPSAVPCNGCGAHLHCTKHTRPGFVPAEIFKGRSIDELKTIICQRCHFLKYYNIALDVEVTPQSYIETIKRIEQQYAMAIVIVDLLDFPCSIWPGLQQLLGPKRPVFVVGNKVDLLPRDRNSYMDHIKMCLKQQMVESGIDVLNIKYVSLISAKTGYGIEELITQLQKIWMYKGDVYLIGCTNVGKSSLFNILLNSDYSRPESSELIRRATVCPWPGTTLQMLRFPIFRPSEIRVYERFRRLVAERTYKTAEQKFREKSARESGRIVDAVPTGSVGRTFVKHMEANDPFAMSSGTQPISVLNERSKDYRQSRWVYDTPGVMHPDQITSLLTTEELLDVEPTKMIQPRAFRLKPGMSLFLAGLARLDFVESLKEEELDWVQVFLFASLRLPVLISSTSGAEEIYAKYLGSPLLGVPFGDASRLSRWPGLECRSEDFVVKGCADRSKDKETPCSADITLSSAGWVGLRLPVDVECRFKAWTPQARGIYLRTPSLIPYAERLIGKRIRNSLAYNISKPFVYRK